MLWVGRYLYNIIVCNTSVYNGTIKKKKVKLLTKYERINRTFYNYIYNT